MNIKHFIALGIFICSNLYTMRIKDLTTIVSFGDQQKTMFEWLRDNREETFGQISIYNTTDQEPFFLQNSRKNLLDELIPETVKTLSPSNLEKIASGKSIFCQDVLQRESYYDHNTSVILCCDEDAVKDNKSVHHTYNKFLLYLLAHAYAKDQRKKDLEETQILVRRAQEKQAEEEQKKQNNKKSINYLRLS